MTLTTGRTKLHEAYKTLQVRWEETREGWGDVACREFEEAFWEPIGPDVESALRAIDRLAVILLQMKNECE
jgi:hypothetical protein